MCPSTSKLCLWPPWLLPRVAALNSLLIKRVSADYMEACTVELKLDRPGVRILELGSGVGWLGMMLAANLPQADTVLCTEQAEGGALSWLRNNIARNSHVPMAALRTSTCDWRGLDSASEAVLQGADAASTGGAGQRSNATSGATSQTGPCAPLDRESSGEQAPTAVSHLAPVSPATQHVHLPGS